MQPVSRSYRPYPDERRVNMHVVFSMEDTKAADTAVPRASGADPVTQLAQLTNGKRVMSGKFATCEPGQWLLDGTFCFLPENTAAGQVGWWSDVLSGQNGTFPAPPVLEFSFPADIQSFGFTVIFDAPAAQWASRIRTTTYRADGSVLTQRTTDNTGPEASIELPSYGYRRVLFEFLSTNHPVRRVRVCSVVFGIIQRFDRNSMTKGALEYAVDPTAEALPSTELTVTIDNLAKRYNMVNPSGLYRYLQEGQELETHIEVGGEKVYMGTLFYTSSKAADDGLAATITAHDRLYTLDSSKYRGGQTGTWTLAQGVAAVLADAEAELPTYIPPALASRPVGRCIPQDTSHREALRLLAQAARCTCHVRRDGVLAFTEFPWGSPVDVLDGSNLTSMGGIAVGERINTVELTVRDEYADTDEVVYTASEPRGVGEGPHVKSVDNPCAVDGQAVADWLLGLCQRRLRYDAPGRGNPATELCDTITIHDAFGGRRNAVVTGLTLTFDGGLNGKTKALGGGWD